MYEKRITNPRTEIVSRTQVEEAIEQEKPSITIICILCETNTFTLPNSIVKLLVDWCLKGVQQKNYENNKCPA